MTSPTTRDWIATYDPGDPELRAAIRRRQTRFYWIFVPVFVVVFIAVRVGLESSERFGPMGLDRILVRTPDWLTGLTLVVAVGLMSAAFAVGVRRSMRQAVHGNPRQLLTRAESRRVGRQIRGLEPVAPYEVPFLRDVARGLYAQRWAALSMSGVLLLVLGGTMLGDDNGVTVPSLLALVPIAIGVYSVRGAVHGRRFLRSIGDTPA
jgi:hypothetical protein